ncbi:MAG: GAF domain-containing protein [Chloroflexi bacterium]|nr:GAF domain-containing protein [Chloroflexota bacterium]
MLTLITVTLITNGLMLTLALAALFLILWQNARREINIYFSLFMIAMLVWSAGSLLSRATALVAVDEDLTVLGLNLIEIGFGGACIALFLLVAALTEIRSFFTWSLAIGSVAMLVLNKTTLSLFDISFQYEISVTGLLNYSFPLVDTLVYLVVVTATLISVWQNLPKIKETSMILGLLVFCLGQLVVLISPRLRALGSAEHTATIAALTISYAIVRSQVMEPLIGRAKELEAVQKIGLAITSSLNPREALQTIAAQAAGLLKIDGSLIFLRRDNELILEAVYNIPEKFLGTRLTLQEGVAGKVARERQGFMLHDYRREWHGVPDIPIALKTFGSVLSVPLMFRDDVVGVLITIEGVEGRLFTNDDLHLLQLLGPQAAVAITNSFLFEKERAVADQLETVLISTENPVISVSHDLKIIFANPAATDLMTDDPFHGSIIGKSLLDYIKSDLLPQDMRGLLRDVRKLRSHVYEVHLKEHDYLCHIARLGKPNRGWVAVLNDVTQLKEIDRLKSQMVRMTSHDLKNPLFATMTYIQLLEEDVEGVESAQRNIASIWKQLDRMERIVNGILDLEKVASGAPPFELCDLTLLLNNAIRSYEDIAVRRNQILQLKADIPSAYVLGDGPQLEQVFTNLIDNAIKFTPEGGTIRVVAESQENNVIISIEDTGMGIPIEAQSQVFDRYFRANGIKDKIPGTGVGLSLVKAIVDRHRGRIWLRSEEGKGSTFYVTLPIALAEPVHTKYPM